MRDAKLQIARFMDKPNFEQTDTFFVASLIPKGYFSEWHQNCPSYLNNQQLGWSANQNNSKHPQNIFY